MQEQMRTEFNQHLKLGERIKPMKDRNTVIFRGKYVLPGNEQQNIK